MTLQELQAKNNYTTDKGTTHSYLKVYDELFNPFQDKEINLLEVGVATGGSLKLWEDYFLKARIQGIDIAYEIKYKYGHRVWFMHSDINRLNFSDIYPNPPDIAIDDGSHIFKDQLAFIELVWPVMNEGGLMIIEDVHDIDKNLKLFEYLNIPFEVMDMRPPHDNVLLIFRK